MRNLMRLLASVSIIALVTASAAVAQPVGPGDAKRVKRINCDNRNQTISRPLQNLQTPLEIIFTGTCTENLVIDRNDVIIRGGAAGATLAGSIYVTGSVRTTLQDFTVSAGDTENAVELQGGSSVRMQNFHVSEFTFRGILVDKGAEAVLADVSSTTTQPGAVIALLARGGTIFLDPGLIELSGSIGGISGTLGGRYFINGADVYMHDNGTGGFFQVNAAVIFQTGKLRAVNNAAFGMVLTSGANIHHGTTEIQASDNGVFGIIVQSNATIVAFPGSTLTLDVSNNPSGGILMQNDAVFIMPGGSQTVSGNGGFAILADNLSNLGLSDNTTVTGPAGTSVLVFDTSFASFGANTDLQVPLVCDNTSNVDGRACDTVLQDSRLDREVTKQLDALLATLNQVVM